MSLFLPKLVVTDIDGVWTDGGMFYDEEGNEWKRFNTYDSAGVLWLKKAGIPLVICTGEKSKSVIRRAGKLDVDYVLVGIKDKVGAIDELISELGIEWAEIAYIGDDLNDIGGIQRAGYTACPCSAPSYIQSRVDLIVKKRGGEGAFREFIECLLGREFIDSQLDSYSQ